MEELCSGRSELPKKIGFRETLKRCKAKNWIDDDEAGQLERLMDYRNPLSHFRDVDDEQNLDRRVMDIRQHPLELLRKDAHFAIALAVRILAKAQFRLG